MSGQYTDLQTDSSGPSWSENGNGTSSGSGGGRSRSDLDESESETDSYKEVGTLMQEPPARSTPGHRVIARWPRIVTGRSRWR